MLDPLMLAVAAGEPDYWVSLGGLLVLLGAATLLGTAFERLRQSAILGYLLAGMILGPNAMGFVPESAPVLAIAELGVAMLLFTIGLEFSWGRLRRMGSAAFAGGALQVFITTVLAAAIVLALKWKPAEAIAAGAMIALSSTAVVLRVLMDRAEADSVHGRLAIGVLLLQDIAVVPLMILITLLGRGGTVLDAGVYLGKTVVFAIALLAAFYVLFRHLLPLLFTSRAVSMSRDFPILVAILTAVGSAYGAHALGLSPALGAFVAGVLLGETPFTHQIRADVSPLRALFVTIFFSSIGMLGDLNWIREHWQLVIGTVGALVVLKAVAGGVALRLLGEPHRHAWAAAICLSQVGEFSFVLARLAQDAQVLSDERFRLIVSATIGSLFVAPYLVSGARPLGQAAEWSLSLIKLANPPRDEPAPDQIAHRDHVLVVGFGPAGQKVAHTLGESGQHVIICDMSPRSRKLASDMGLECHQGDAARPQVLEHLHIEAARALVVTIPDSRAAVEIIRSARDLNPDLQIIARARYHLYVSELQNAGATAVVDEEEHVGKRLAAEARLHLRAKT
jgi:CPA2 family monovalent cation:H+ antiporter-2